MTVVYRITGLQEKGSELDFFLRQTTAQTQAAWSRGAVLGIDIVGTIHWFRLESVRYGPQATTVRLTPNDKSKKAATIIRNLRNDGQWHEMSHASA